MVRIFWTGYHTHIPILEQLHIRNRPSSRVCRSYLKFFGYLIHWMIDLQTFIVLGKIIGEWPRRRGWQQLDHMGSMTDLGPTWKCTSGSSLENHHWSNSIIISQYSLEGKGRKEVWELLVGVFCVLLPLPLGVQSSIFWVDDCSSSITYVTLEQHFCFMSSVTLWIESSHCPIGSIIQNHVTK